ncbi:hypothetical protein VARV_IND64_vel4_199 [Variola virus]|uniref:Uncharacterized protein n=1 Tax=Variola virus TaxID=10255 RepID=Q0N4V6_VARV|nr:hypothetical protein VARV_YUG72_164_199 [Variola virus]ABG43361.1 hypothetical protein VARV_AFG70_vlt4_199 [Variola virus]ABG44375.1 hypothetical protein VARV_IND64_vel4_199 [Variola virus]ABG44780.1 hypothetical protein VARV_IRN72_tbrz_199 [Variola virus]ABG45185.1 hypothetical protein VARV_PAK69_lah_199 [Variola virus]
MVHIPIVKYIKRMLMSNISTLITTDAFKKQYLKYYLIFFLLTTMYIYTEKAIK